MVDALKWHSIRSLRELRSFRMDYTRNIAIGKHTSSLWLFCSFPLFKHWGMTTSEIEGTTQALNVCRRFPFFRNTLLSFVVDVSRSFLPAFLPPRRIIRRYKLESTKRRTALFLFWIQPLDFHAQSVDGTFYIRASSWDTFENMFTVDSFVFHGCFPLARLHASDEYEIFIFQKSQRANSSSSSTCFLRLHAKNFWKWE